MKKDKIRVNNVIFPLWLLWIFPITWIIILPANFIIDLLVIIIAMKVLKIDDIKKIAKSTILKVWAVGFLADFIGMIPMFISNVVQFEETSFLGYWWNKNISIAVAFNPFDNIYAFIWVTVCVAVSAFCIYMFNYKISFKRVDIEDNKKRKLSLSLALITAPYLFYVPTMLFVQ